MEGASLLSDSDLDLLKPWTLGSPCEVGGGKGRILITTSEKRCEFGRVERRQKPLCLLLRVFILGIKFKLLNMVCRALIWPLPSFHPFLVHFFCLTFPAHQPPVLSIFLSCQLPCTSGPVFRLSPLPGMLFPGLVTCQSPFHLIEFNLLFFHHVTLLIPALSR